MTEMAQVLDQVAAYGVVPVVVLDDASRAQGLAQALLNGGLPVAEVTFRTPAAAESIATMSRNEGLIVGAGTVLTVDQVDQAAAAGARFIVSPGLNRDVVERTLEHGLLPLPGAVTATEIQAALEHGLDTLKFFPASTSGGPAAIKAFSGPFGMIDFMPTGGVGLGNLDEYLSLPNVRAVGGSWMTPRDAINNGDFTRIETLCTQAVSAARGILDTKKQ